MFILRLSNDPAAEESDVVIAQQKPATKRTVRDLASWMEAWNVYAQVLAATYPARATELDTGLDNILLALPCESAATNRTVCWDHKNNELWLESFTHSLTSSLTHPPQSSAKTSRRPCTYCGSLYHYSENCPSHPFRPSRRQAGSPRAPSPEEGHRHRKY